MSDNSKATWTCGTLSHHSNVLLRIKATSITLDVNNKMCICVCVSVCMLECECASRVQSTVERQCG